MDNLSILTLGDAGSFSHQASLVVSELLSIKDIKFAKSNSEVVRQTVENFDKYIGVVPFETTGGGLIPEVINELLNNLEKKPKICQEYIMPIEQCLAYKDTLSKIYTVVSHSQALLQCQKYLNSLRKGGLNFVEKRVETTTQAAFMASEDESVAAICPKLAAELYDFPQIICGIQDSKHNETRFIVIHDKDDGNQTKHDRTTLTYEVENVPNALWNAIGVFSRRGLNLSGQHSIASRIKLGDYRMVTEVEAHRLDDVMQRALMELVEWILPDSLYIFGSYPKQVNSK